jgi:L1 cell adhesion molecule like protein
MKVPLGVIPKNENLLGDMVAIMKTLQQYAPQYHFDDGLIEAHIFQKTLLGGDYLTAKRARGSQLDKCNELTATEQLRGLVPISEDWHTRQCLMTVSYILYTQVHAHYTLYSYINPP